MPIEELAATIARWYAVDATAARIAGRLATDPAGAQPPSRRRWAEVSARHGRLAMLWAERAPSIPGALDTPGLDPVESDTAEIDTAEIDTAALDALIDAHHRDLRAHLERIDPDLDAPSATALRRALAEFDAR